MKTAPGEAGFALLDLMGGPANPAGPAAGLVEVRRQFRKAARKHGLKPALAREARGAYDAGRETERVPRLALFCSVRCPGKLILDGYDLARRLRDERVTVIGGFHSPLERECLTVVLRSPNAVVWVLARGRLSRIPPELQPAAAAGRLQILAPFPDTVTRITPSTANRRNRVAAGMADAVICVHAAAGGAMERFCRRLLKMRKPVYTFDHPANAWLIEAGARAIGPGQRWGEPWRPAAETGA